MSLPFPPLRCTSLSRSFFFVLLSMASIPSVGEASTLYLRSGFNSGVTIDTTQMTISGTDSTVGGPTGNWSTLASRVPGFTRIGFGAGGTIPTDYTFRIVDGGAGRGPVYEQNLLRNSRPATTWKTRTSTTFFYGAGGAGQQFEKGYFKFKMKLDARFKDALVEAPGWFQLFEAKGDPEGGAYSRRYSIQIMVAQNGSLSLVYRTINPVDQLWRVTSPVQVPFGEWFDVELFMHSGVAGVGRFYYTINGQVVFDVKNRALFEDAPLTEISIWKIYEDTPIIDWMRENAGGSREWYDDLEYWSDIPSSPPPPPATPKPTVTLTATPAAIDRGESVTVHWTSEYATACDASGAWDGAQSVSGTQTYTPDASTTYELTCVGAGGTTTTQASVSVRVPTSPGGGGSTGGGGGSSSGGGSGGGGGGSGGKSSPPSSNTRVGTGQKSTPSTSTPRTASGSTSKQWIHVHGPGTTNKQTVQTSVSYGKPYFTYRGTSAYLLKAHRANNLIIIVAGSGSYLQRIGSTGTINTGSEWKSFKWSGVRPVNTDGTFTGQAYYIIRSTDPLYATQGAFAANMRMTLPGCDNVTCNVNGWLLQEYRAE